MNKCLFDQLLQVIVYEVEFDWIKRTPEIFLTEYIMFFWQRNTRKLILLWPKMPYSWPWHQYRVPLNRIIRTGMFVLYLRTSTYDKCLSRIVSDNQIEGWRNRLYPACVNIYVGTIVRNDNTKGIDRAYIELFNT